MKQLYRKHINTKYKYSQWKYIHQFAVMLYCCSLNFIIASHPCEYLRYSLTFSIDFNLGYRLLLPCERLSELSRQWALSVGPDSLQMEMLVGTSLIPEPSKVIREVSMIRDVLLSGYETPKSLELHQWLEITISSHQ